MDYFFKYTSINEQDKAWQLYLTVVGKSRYLPNMDYPSVKHPAAYFFPWNEGRIIHEYQIIYITKGQGIFETKSDSYTIIPGSVIILKKGKWHRYKPLKEFGWTENYIGFDGEIADFFLQTQKGLANIDVVQLGEQEVLIDTFHKIFELVKSETPCFQQIASGMIVKLLGYILSMENKKSFSGNTIEKIIQEVCYKIREQLEDEFNFEKMVQNYNVSCSHLRKMFKQYTGKSPHQYYLDMKIIRAKELLTSTKLSIKEIAIDLGFESIHYFSRLFKIKVGVAPSTYRAR